jgi:hypothetical protein
MINPHRCWSWWSVTISLWPSSVRIYHLFTSLVKDPHDHHPCEDLSSIYILGYRSPWPASVRIYHLFTSLVTDHNDHHPCEGLSSIYILGYRSPWPPSVWGFIIYLHPSLQITMTTIHVRIYHLFTSLVTDHHDHHPCEWMVVMVIW